MKPSEFKKLQKKWYAKLKSEGFKDIENTDKPDGMLKQQESSRYRTLLKGQQPEVWLEKQQIQWEYYRLTRQFLHDHKFENEKIKKMWELHSEGLGLRQIQVQVGVNYNKIENIIRDLVKIMLSSRRNREDDLYE